MLAKRIVSMFGRLVKPRISKYQDVFELIAEKDHYVKEMQAFTSNMLRRNSSMNFSDKIQEDFGISKSWSEEIAQRVVQLYAYSPISNKEYPVKFNFNQSNSPKPNIDILPEEAEIPYSPDQRELKTHFSVAKKVPIIEDYEIDEKSVYIFNLPEDVTEKQLGLELGMRNVKKVQMSYCVLGLPACARVEFNSEQFLTDLILEEKEQIQIRGRICPIIFYTQKEKLKKDRRRVVIKNLKPNENPAQVLKTVSQYGRVVSFDMPMEVYREPSVEQIKDIYAGQRYPIKINYHRINGTIDSEFYPPLNEQSQNTVEYVRSEYRRRMRYCEEVDVHEGEEGQIKTRSKGYCVITYSIQSQAQNLYFYLRNFMQMSVLNNQQEFLFDSRHREALLRHIDHQYIEKKLEEEKYQNYDEDLHKKDDDIIEYMQNLFYNLLLDKMITKEMFIKQNATLTKQLMVSYRSGIDKLIDSIGKGHADGNADNLYGKSFSQVAEQELFGKRIKKYDVKVADPKQKEFPLPLSHPLNRDFGGEFDEENVYYHLGLASGARKPRVSQNTISQGPVDEEEVMKIQRKQQNTENYSGHNSFSTVKSIDDSFQAKPLQAFVRTQLKYAEFVRDAINEYMGVFPQIQYEASYNKSKPTFTNPQSLYFSDGTPFLQEEEVQKVMEHSPNSSQEMFSTYIKQNQICKSLNIDIQEKVLKNFDDNALRTMKMAEENGIISEVYEAQEGEDIHEKIQQLNRFEAEHGEQFRISTNQEGKECIVKINKVDHIMPLKALGKLEGFVKDLEKTEDFDPKKMKLANQFFHYLEEGKPLPWNIALELGFEPGAEIRIEDVLHGLAEESGVNLKDLEAIFNSKKFSQKEINEDIALQIEFEKMKEDEGEVKPSDYSKDPSSISVKDKDGKFKVSKFRQI